MELSPTAYVILGLVRVNPRTGYEIKATVDQTTRFFWAISYGQIYPELKRLAEAGLIEGTERPTGGRQRVVFSITEAGLEELQAWLRRPPETLEMRHEGLLKLFFAGALPPVEAIGTLHAISDRHRETLDQLREIEPGAEMVGGFPLMVLRGGIEMSEFFVDWCGRMERELESAGAEGSAA